MADNRNDPFELLDRISGHKVTSAIDDGLADLFATREDENGKVVRWTDELSADERKAIKMTSAINRASHITNYTGGY